MIVLIPVPPVLSVLSVCSFGSFFLVVCSVVCRFCGVCRMFVYEYFRMTLMEGSFGKFSPQPYYDVIVMKYTCRYKRKGTKRNPNFITLRLKSVEEKMAGKCGKS